ncbi:protein AATF [Aphis craccivora]|uniref:Protein AATF n=1 Tax=Aphis craccivora TaxID=307492 RepID=A0A6G0YU47_APHCR|nr:protein AATF [Aphis craccivora]
MTHFYENLLLLRIKLQKCLAVANTLPQDIDKITTEYKEVCAYDTVKDLEHDKDKASTLTNKLNLIDFDNVLQAHHEIFKPYRYETIQFWNERIKFASGKAAKSDFSAFDQPT